MRQVTLLFLVKNNQVLLAMKKRGFGEGKWNGYGGKPKLSEKITNTAIRETQEEIGVIPKNIKQVAVINFYNQDKPKWDQQAIVFITKEWKGDPTETDEMKPQWFNLDEIPFKSMWIDDLFWLPLVLENKKIKASFTFKKDQIIKQEIKEIESF